MDSYIGHTVVNLSDIQLTPDQYSALEKGLTFCPTPGPPDKSKIWSDFKDFYRRLCLKYHFHKDNGHFDHLTPEEADLVGFLAHNLDESENPYKDIHSQFKNKSNWKPPNTHQSLEVFSRAFKSSLLKAQPKAFRKSNLTKNQKEGLRTISLNPEIVIKKADKGSAIVVMNTKDYLREGYRQLSDPDFYCKLDHDPTPTIKEKIDQTLTQMRAKGLITEDNFDYLSIDNFSEGRFYLLPKIHKKGVPGRPICSSVNHPTSRISRFVDEHIKGYVPKTKSYIRDTQDFITKLKSLGRIPEGAILCTLDVSSLYTNIPNQEGILAVAEKLRSDPSKTPITKFILDLLSLVLHNMNFEFNGEHYLQTGGTAMGTSVAPNYANLFMDRFETKALEGYHLKPLTWLRFIDDIFMIWTHGEDSLKEFITYLNSLHHSIKFTHEFSRTSINFLDTTVKFGENRELITTLFNKPTDTHLYLHYTSAHQTSILTKGPFSQYLRLRRICTLDEDFKHNARNLTGYYIKRGYPLKSLKNHFQRAHSFSQDQLLEVKTKTDSIRPVMVTNFSPKNPNVTALIRDNWNIIQNTEELHTIFPELPIMGFRRLPNLRDQLTSARISYPPIERPIRQRVFTPVCTRLGKCTYCPRIKRLDSITSFSTKRSFQCKNLPPKHQITCELSNLVYLINCSKCGLQYIGETKRPLRQRMYEHSRSVQNIKLQSSTPVARHFSNHGHSARNMEFSVLHWMGSDSDPNDTVGRRDQELFYIWAFPTLQPAGINVFV